ncbi:MAG: GNAT family N-acetyltransferase [Bryobacteraceae bacterium]
MAARLDPTPVRQRPELVDLRHLEASDLDPLLDEEVETWRSLLQWDFGKSADLVRRFVDLRALNGYAIVEDGDVAGYGYYVLEEHKGLVGDLFMREESRDPDSEIWLLDTILHTMVGGRQISRIESQLMMAHSVADRSVPYARYHNAFQRNFMMLDLQEASLGPARHRSALANRVYYERWSEHYQEPASQLIATAYLGHVDSLINDQYRSVPGARRFLFNIVQYPGCGTFFKPASFAAFERSTGRVAGICLASLVMPHCGHITQICIAPGVRGAGVGYELLRQSLTALRAAGCTRTSLTVTASNHEAIRLYEDVGFQTIRQFYAYVWEGF